MKTQPVPLKVQPGIKRDGTILDGNQYIDGQWCRFQAARPRKMGGYRAVTTTPEIARGISSFSSDGIQYLHIGGPTTLYQYQVNNTGTLNGTANRTPGGFASSVDNLWQIDTFFQAGSTNQNQIVAHAAPNLTNIDNETETTIWLGSVTESGALTDSGLPPVSGGILAVGNFLFTFGSDGRLGWSKPNNPEALQYEAVITPQKIIKGLPLRGTGTGPAALFWSLDSLIRATFAGGTVIWNFDTIVSDISVMSSQGIIEYDGVYYWIGMDRFQYFNGVVQELPNPFNADYFFDNVNYQYRQKVFAFKVPRFGEIWWCYPRGSATECTHALIFNVLEKTWYDTALPDEGRSVGLYAKVYSKPFMVGVEADTYYLWQHETDRDRIVGSDIQSIQSYFETNEISLLESAGGGGKSVYAGRLEPDFVQVGDMSLTVKGRSNSRSPIISAAPLTFSDTAANPDDETLKMKEIRRLMSFRFESNAQGGHYESGEHYVHISPADGRIES